jgi:hypothetical protein
MRGVENRAPPSNDFEAHNFLGGSNFQGEKEKRN